MKRITLSCHLLGRERKVVNFYDRESALRHAVEIYGKYLAHDKQYGFTKDIIYNPNPYLIQSSERYSNDLKQNLFQYKIHNASTFCTKQLNMNHNYATFV